MKQKQFGRDWTDGDLKFPEHLTPKTIHSALFIYNAKSAEETKQRVEYCARRNRRQSNVICYGNVNATNINE